MSFRRIPKEIDPRRPPKRHLEGDEAHESEARSYGQYIDASRDDLDELERVTDEVAREGGKSDADESSTSGSQSKRRTIEEREAFEDATDEVSREDGESNGQS